MDCRVVDFSGHAVRRMFKRSVGRDEVLEAITKGEVIEAYPQDTPYPSYLLLARSRERVLHVVVARDADRGHCYVVTVYPPDPDLWEPDFRTRRAS